MEELGGESSDEQDHQNQFEDDAILSKTTSEQTMLEHKYVFWVTMFGGQKRQQPGVSEAGPAKNTWESETKPIAKFQTVRIIIDNIC